MLEGGPEKIPNVYHALQGYESSRLYVMKNVDESADFVPLRVDGPFALVFSSRARAFTCLIRRQNHY